MFLPQSLIALFQKMSDKIQHIIWLWKSTTERNYKISQLIIQEISVTKVLWRFAEDVKLNLNKISKPLWINVSRENFNSLIKYGVDNLDNKDYKTTLDGDKYEI